MKVEYKKSTISCVHHKYNCCFVFFKQKIIQTITIFILKSKILGQKVKKCKSKYNDYSIRMLAEDEQNHVA